MEVKPGYKPTEIGPIPEEWNLKGLGEVASLDVGLSKPGIVFGSGCPVVTVQDLYSGATVSVAGLKRVVVTNEEIQKYRLTKDDILIGNASVKRDGIGYANRFDGAVEDVIFAKYAYRASNLRSILPLYLLYALRADFCRHWIVANSQTGTLTNLNKAAARAIPIPVPETIGEQRAIASALFDVDALLAGLDRLSAKKRDIKQAAMQQLLTGQTRLPGFKGEWEVKRLGEHVAFLKNGVHSRAELTTNGPIKNLHYGDIHASRSVILDPSSMPSLSNDCARALGRLMNGDLVFVDASEDLDGVGKSVEIVGAAGVQFVAGLHTIAARFDPSVLAHGFKAYLQFCPPFRLHLKRLAAGTKVYATNRRHIASAEMLLPSVQEQSSIAAVLSDMDAELTALEARHDKTRALKQGMMQELLTGRTRLI